jgi:hypothetical protein
VPDGTTLIAAAVMLAPPVVLLVQAALRATRQHRSDQRIARQVAERAASRTLAPGTTSIEGIIEAEGDVQLELVERRQHGCLGGPLMYEVPPFRLRLADGRSISVDVGPDPEFREPFRLPPRPRRVAPPVPLEIAPPLPTGAPTVYPLHGALRVSGIAFIDDARVAPPPGYSATLEVASARS